MLSAVNERYQTALMYAVRSGKPEIVNAVAELIGEAWVPSNSEVTLRIACCTFGVGQSCSVGVASFPEALACVTS